MKNILLVVDITRQRLRQRRLPITASLLERVIFGLQHCCENILHCRIILVLLMYLDDQRDELVCGCIRFVHERERLAGVVTGCLFASFCQAMQGNLRQGFATHLARPRELQLKILFRPLETVEW